MTKDFSLSAPVEDADLRVISLGAGVQSSVMALLAARGEIGPMPDAAIFADTGWEPQSVYDNLEWLDEQLPFPIYDVSAGSIRDNIIAATKASGSRFVALPFFVEGGIGRRQCTNEFKIEPIRRKVRELLGVKKGKRVTASVEQWIGITTDELQRLKIARDKWTTNRWPLIELRWNRAKCLLWFQREYPGMSLTKSSCIGCPFHSDRHWAEMKRDSPKEFADAVVIDKMLRADGPLRGMKKLQYMHRSCRPLNEVDFRKWES